MFKLITYVFKFLIALCLVGTLSFIGIITLVDPNRFKHVVQKQIFEATGQNLTINGTLSWHIMPILSLEAHDLSLKLATEPRSTQVSLSALTLKKIRFTPKLWSLLSGQPLVDIQLDGLNATLHRSIATQSLLDNIQKVPLLRSFKNQKSFRILPYDISIENATLHWKDAINNQEIRFNNIKLLAQKIPLSVVGTHTPLKIHLELQDVNSKHTGNFSLNAMWAFNAKRQQVDIQDLACNSNFPDLPFNTFYGKFQIHRLDNLPIIVGHFHIPHLNVQHGLSNFNMPLFLSTKTADLKGIFTYQRPMLAVTSFNLIFENEAAILGSFKTDLHAKTFKTLRLTGNFIGKNLRIGTLPIPEIETTLQANNGIFIFDHIKAQLANSHHQAKMQIDIREDVPQFILSDQMDSFEINELLARLDLKDKLYGNIKATANLTTQGESPEACLEHLSGHAYVHLTDGRVSGIDLSPLLRHAQSTLVMLKDTLSKRNSANISAILTAELGEWRSQAMNNVDPLVTPFKHLETKITFDRGRAYTADFKLTHPEYTVNGHGMVDLMQKNVEYQALALLTHPKQHPSESFSLFLKETPLAIQLKGSFDNLSVQPNLAHYADGAINVVHKTTAEKASDGPNTLEKLFGFP